ncbi:30S ribosomal protein S4 [Patescibacteria group bacterium]|nr:30S ribosomal protein S4 [Patescibacteria group bacterium]MBU4512922.1 30S ribosomal protein S4 [Patescibacteria group bacterium]
MARNLDPKCKQCRRIGEKLFLKGERCNSTKCALVKRKYPPGVHGPKRRIRVSEYGLQLREKQKAKKMYRLMETQFANYVKKAMNLSGDAGNNLLGLLEQRLDSVLYRTGIVKSRDAARQAISHGLIKVNGKKVDIPSYILRVGEVVTVKDSSILVKQFKEEGAKTKKENESLPNWISLDPKILEIKVLTAPDAADLPHNLDIRLIIEYYSR